MVRETPGAPDFRGVQSPRNARQVAVFPRKEVSPGEGLTPMRMRAEARQLGFSTP